jgi:hypothetical protein
LLKTQVKKNFIYIIQKKDRLPWKTVEGKKICGCTKVFDSKTDSVTNIDITNWNGGNQIMSYEEFGY